MIPRIQVGPLSLSRLGLGCWTLAGQHWGEDPGAAATDATARAAWERGINWFDTAPAYAWGQGEERLAPVLRALPEALVATKVGPRHDEAGAVRSDLRPAGLRSQLEASLRRLGRDRIDLLQLHWPCQFGSALPEVLEELQRVQQEGLIRAFGACNYGPADLPLLAAAGAVSLQLAWSPLRRESEAALLPALIDSPLRGIGYEVLVRGLLARPWSAAPRFPQTDQRSWDERFRGRPLQAGRELGRAVAGLAQRLGVAPAAVVLFRALQQPGLDLALVGARGPAQIRQSAQVARLLAQPAERRVRWVRWLDRAAGAALA